MNISEQHIFTVCSFCKLSEEETMCDIYIDKKCGEMHSCVRCLYSHLNQLCAKCPQKLKDHHKKHGNRKQYILEQGSKLFDRQFKVRSSWEQVDPQLVNILAYYYRKRKGTEYSSKENELKLILEDLKKRQKMIIGDHRKMRIPQYLSRENNDPTGKEACGYRNSYEKGMKFLFDAFQI